MNDNEIDTGNGLTPQTHLASHFALVEDPRPIDTPWPNLSWPPRGDIHLEGRVVELTVAAAERDSEPLFAALDDDRVWEFVAGRPRSPVAMADLLTTQIELGRFPWLVRLRVDYRGVPAGTIVGASAFLDVSPADARLEIGWTSYRPDLWGSAVNPDTKLVLLSYAFEVLGAGRVQLKTDVRNIRSQSAIAQLGAHYEGTLRRYQKRDDGTVRDTVMFSIIAEEWSTLRQRLNDRLDAILDATFGPRNPA